MTALLSSAFGYYFGFREGASAGLLVEWVPRAYISLHNLEAIRSGNNEKAFGFLESDIDNGLMWTYQLDKNPLKPLMEPLWGLPISEREKFLTRIADYRKTHQSPMSANALSAKPVSPSQSAESRQWLLDGATETDEIIASMVAKYASSSDDK